MDSRELPSSIEKLLETIDSLFKFIPGDKPSEITPIEVDGYHCAVIDASQITVFGNESSYFCLGRNVSFCSLVKLKLNNGGTAFAHVLSSFKPDSIDEKNFYLRLKRLIEESESIEVIIPKFGRSQDDVERKLREIQDLWGIRSSNISVFTISENPETHNNYSFGYSANVVFTKNGTTVIDKNNSKLENMEI